MHIKTLTIQGDSPSRSSRPERICPELILRSRHLQVSNPTVTRSPSIPSPLNTTSSSVVMDRENPTFSVRSGSSSRMRTKSSLGRNERGCCTKGQGGVRS